MKRYEVTYECTNGDWRWWEIEAWDFQAACENALQSTKTFTDEDTTRPYMKGARLISVRLM